MIEKTQNDTPSSIVSTEDGSQTLISPVFGEKYHSKYGAQTESQIVFIDAGLKDRWHLEQISILEMGFGTGLNTVMSLQESRQQSKYISYTGYEKFPVPESTYELINYGTVFNLEDEFQNFHKSTWNEPHQIDSNFNFTKIKGDINDLADKDEYDVIYFDAFAPNAQEELWSVELFTKMFLSLKQDGVLVTYCAKGQVKRNLKAAGFTIEPLPGPPGKREMTRARKV